MARIIGVVLAVVFGLMLVADLARAAGAATFAAKCKMCHGADGKGNTVMGVKSFDLTKSDADLTKAISEGVKPKMPAFGEKLSDIEVDELIKYLRSLK